MLIAAGADTTKRCSLNTVWGGDAAAWADKFEKGDYKNCIWLLLNPAAAKAEFNAEKAQADAAGLLVDAWYKTRAAASHERERKRYDSLEWYHEWKAKRERSRPPMLGCY